MREIKERLQAELRALEHEFKVELPREIGEAAAMGDLKENAEYHAARERQSFVKAKIGDLQARLSAVMSLKLDQVPSDKVGLGSVVKLLNEDTDEEVTYELVFPELSDLENGLISIASPIGKSLVGLAEGDSVEVQIPSGVKCFEVLELTTIHDKESGD
jgi:transcription elongation factor GreA